MAGETEWILMNGRMSVLVLRHAATKLAQIAIPPNCEGVVNKIWFSADPHSGMIYARWLRPSGTPIVEAQWFQVAIASWPEFKLLRPSVVIAGCGTAIVRSGQTDWPADYQEFIMVTAARS